MSDAGKDLLRRIEAIDDAAGDNRRRAEAYERMAKELKQVEGRATSPDGVVSVVAGPGGAVNSIVFSDRVRNVTPEVLSGTVMHTLARARAAAARAQAEVVSRGLGDTDLLDKVLASDETLFGDQLPTDPGPPPAATGRLGRHRSDEDYFEGFNVLQHWRG